MCLLFVFKIPWWLRGKESTCNAGDGGSTPGLGRSSGEGNGNPLQYSCLGNPMDRGAWRAAVCGATKSQTRRSTHSHTTPYELIDFYKKPVQFAVQSLWDFYECSPTYDTTLLN